MSIHRLLCCVLLYTLILNSRLDPVWAISEPVCGNIVSNKMNCSVDIVEEVEAGTLVFDTVQHLPDYDGSNDQFIFLSSESSLFDEHFQYDDTYEITTTGVFDREVMVSRDTAPFPVNLTVDIAFYHGLEFVGITLFINIIDLNDNVPIFKRGSVLLVDGVLALTVTESPIPNNFLFLEPVDYDEGDNGSTIYALIQADPPFFNMTIDQDNGGIPILQVKPNDELDREIQDYHEFQITASEGTENPNIATLNVSLTVGDIDDSGPSFPITEFTRNVSEESMINTTIVQVMANDPDAGTNAEIEYVITDVCARASSIDSSCIDVSQPWPFALDTESGILTLGEMLNYEDAVRYRITIDARNPNNPIGSATAVVKIEVQDINDQPPRVINFQPIGNLSEKAAVDSIFATFEVHDSDSEANSKYNLSLLDQTTQQMSTTFNLQYGSLISVVLSTKVDREIKDRYDLVIVAVDSLNSSLNTTYPFTVLISDINDHFPVFGPVPDPITISENSVNATIVYQLNATDNDIGINQEIRYILPEQSEDYPYQDKFDITPLVGTVLVAGSLDREDTEDLFILVEAVDENGAGQSTSIVLNITLEDVNDNNPIITSTIPAQISRKENDSVGTFILDVDATDADIGSNAQLTYSIIGLSPENVVLPITIDPNSGVITTNDTLDREFTSQYLIEISVTDGYSTPAKRNLTLIIQDVNDNNPYFPQALYEKTIYENASINTIVATVVAEDDDSSEFTHISYSFTDGFDHDHFSLHSETGVITTAVSLDWETNSVYTFKVRANDGFGRQSTADATIMVTIADINDEIPQFTGLPYYFEVDENSDAGAFVGQVFASSVEEGDHGSAIFSIINTETVPFSIDEITGIISTTDNLDRENKDIYHLLLTVQDVAPPPHFNTTMAIVTVMDTNDNPPVFEDELVQLTLSELQTVNIGFYTAVAVDNDLSPYNSTEYFLAEDTTGFKIEKSTGVLILTTSLNYETQQSVLLEVIAKDKNKPDIYQDILEVNITVLDDNNTNITFPSNFPLQYDISEDTSLGHILLNFTGTDSKGNPNLHLNYYLSYADGGTPSEFIIEVESATGYALLSTIDYLNREEKSSYVLNVTIADNSIPRSIVTQFLTVNILDINDNSPSFISSPYSFSFEEEQDGELDIGTIEANDPDLDENGTIVYSLKTPSALFSIDATSGVLRQLVPLDRESDEVHTIVVVASDQGNPPRKRETTVTINVIDVNDHCPSFSPSYIQIEENVQVGTVIETLTGIDLDSGSNGEITFYSTEQSTAKTHFLLLSDGTIQVTQVPDFEKENEFIFYIIALDGADTSCQTTGNVTIEIRDQNDHCPFFTGTPEYYTINVPENTETGEYLLNITAVDPDTGLAGEVRYTLENVAEEHQFVLGLESGILELKNSLDYEEKSQHVIGVLAYDLGTPRNRVCRQTVTINVININEYKPSFDKTVYTLLVPENEPSYTFVGLLKAYDLDSDSSISYTITQIHPESGNDFMVSENLGFVQLTTLSELNYETESFYILRITALDEGGKIGETTIRVLVENLNDEDPVFSQDEYGVSLSESTSIDTPILAVMATDADNNTNNAVTYFITGGNDGEAFTIDPISGLISVSSQLDYENTETYSLTIEAVDTGNDPRTATATAVITILNKNEHTPQFSSDEYTFNVQEEEPTSMYIGTVTATDDDNGEYGDIEYLFESPSNYFSIDSSSGVIRTDVRIDREDTPNLDDLVVIATDSSKSSTATVHFIVNDTNDNPPIFSKPLYEISIPFDQSPDISIGKVIPLDADTPPNAITQYSIVEIDEDTPFGVNSTSGNIYLDTSIASNYKTSYQFILVATDIQNSSLTDQTLVNVYTYSDNDHHPSFNMLEYHVNVTEGLPLPANPILTVTAIDNDNGANGDVTYSFNNSFGIFSINSNGDISLLEALDYEKTISYDLIVYATDATPAQPRTAITRVFVSVINENDNPPNFINPPSSLTLSPVPYIGVNLFVLRATDPDNSSFSFTLLSQTNKFKIDSETGIVSNKIILENGTFNSLNFRVSDGINEEEITILVTVTTPPSDTPSFEDESEIVELSISEGEEVGYTLRTFTAINPSKYNLVCCGTAFSVFELDQTTGILSLQSSLDFETETFYELVVEGREEDGNTIYSDYVKVEIEVKNVNEFTPVFSGDVEVSVNENIGEEKIITDVTATDDDSGSYGSVTYSIIDGNEGDAFEIISTTGVIRVAPSVILDREAVEEYNLIVKATDGQKFSTIGVKIILQDENDSPPIYSGNFTVGIYEPGKPGDRVGSVLATDPDASSELLYSLGIVETYLGFVSAGPVSSVFEIDSSTAEITLKSSLDHEIANLYVIPVSATDGVFTVTTYLNVTVFDINDNSPMFQQNDYSMSIKENSRPGTVLVEASAVDYDSGQNGIVRYNLGDDWPEGKFTIDQMSGTVRVEESVSFLDFSSDCDVASFTSSIIATDGVFTEVATVTVTIDDINNHAPEFIGSPYSIITSETAELDQKIATFTIEDLDCGLNQYIITKIPDYYIYPKVLFKLNSLNDEYQLMVASPLVQGIYHFRIQAYNGLPFPSNYYQAGYGNFTVTVMPENVHTPKFNSTAYTFSVFENSDIETFIGVVYASDEDLGDTGLVHYTVLNNVPFEVHETSGVITVAGSLDRETISHYVFTVVATDHGYPTKSSSVNVSVSIADINDNLPIFVKQSYEGSVLENASIGLNLFTIEANDTDLGNSASIQYSLETNENNLPFQIDSVLGIISTSGELDFEHQSLYQFNAKAEDLGESSQSSKVSVTIYVQGVNEFAPVFPSYGSFNISSTKQRGDHVGTVEATDEDDGPDGELTYYFINPPEEFIMLPNGTIVLNIDPISEETTFDRERKKRQTSEIIVTADVEAVDGGIPHMSAITTITLILPNTFETTKATAEVDSLSTPAMIGIVSAVLSIIIILVVVVIVGSVLAHKRKQKTKLDLHVTNFHRPSTPGTTTTNLELQRYMPRDTELQDYTVEPTTLQTQQMKEGLENVETPDAGLNRPSLRTRSTSDLASSVATDTLNLTQESGFPFSKSQIEQIYATNVDLLHDQSQDSVHMFGSEGGGEAEGDELDDMMFAKYDMGDDDMSYCGKDRQSMISESSEGVREDEYQFSQSTNPWSSRHGSLGRSMNELTGDSSRGMMFQYDPSQGPSVFGASTQGSSISLIRQQHQRDIALGRYPAPEYFPEVDTSNRVRQYGPPLDYRVNNAKIPRGPPPPPYYPQDPNYTHSPHMYTQNPHSYTQGSHYYMGSRSPDPPRSLHNYEQMLSNSSTSLSTNASQRGRGYPRGHY